MFKKFWLLQNESGFPQQQLGCQKFRSVFKTKKSERKNSPNTYCFDTKFDSVPLR